MLNNYYNALKLNYFPLMFSIFIPLWLNMLNNLMWNSISASLIFMNMFLLFYFIYTFLMALSNENLMMGKFSFKKNSINNNGFILFILSETMVFVSLFWSYIHNAYSPNQFMGNYWPPKGIQPSSPTGMIIFGTAILLSSSFIIMLGHHNLLNKNNKIKSLKIFLTIFIMGLVFTDMQILEMSNYMVKLQFNLNDSVFSSSFLMTTSLHASHVILGMMGILMSSFLYMKNMNNKSYFSNLEMSIWYWHFVDYIWIGVFTIFYYLNS